MKLVPPVSMEKDVSRSAHVFTWNLAIRLLARVSVTQDSLGPTALKGAPQGPLEQRAEKNASAWLIIQKGATLRMEHVTVSLVI